LADTFFAAGRAAFTECDGFAVLELAGACFAFVLAEADFDCAGFGVGLA
jgi:hypothetical protein